MGYKRHGFTLVEVLVAMLVLSIGGVATNYYFSAFSSMCKREREVVKAVVAATEYIENAIVNPVSCMDSVFVVNVEDCVFLSVKETTLYGISKLVNLEIISMVGCSSRRELPVVFRRVVFCK